MGAYTTHGYWVGDGEPRPPKIRARCGGPGFCLLCKEQEAVILGEALPSDEKIRADGLAVARQTVRDHNEGRGGPIPPGALWMASALLAAVKEIEQLTAGDTHEACEEARVKVQTAFDAAQVELWQLRETLKHERAQLRQQGATDAVRRLHSKRSYPGDGFTSELCVECRQAWPCPTIKELEQ